MWKTSDDMMKAAHGTLNAALGYRYLSVGVEIQSAVVQKLDNLIEDIDTFRQQSIAQQVEESANLAWIIGKYADAVRQFISIWIHIKNDQMESAWNALVD